MSVLRDPGRGTGIRHAFAFLLLFALLAAGGTARTMAQQEATVDAVEESRELWAAVTETYEVVVLSRGLLLEPLDDGVELMTIEIIDDRVAVDGDSIDEPELAERIGGESAALAFGLAAMDREERRALFVGEEVAMLDEAMEDEAMEDEATEDEAMKDEASERQRDGDRDRRKRRDSEVAVGSSLTVREDEFVKEAVVFGGPLIVHGKVAGDAVAIGGSVTVSGEVTEDVAAVGGDLILEAGAEVGGDVVSVGGEVKIDDDARVGGQIIEVPLGPKLRFGAWPAAIFGRGHDWRAGEDHFEFSPWGVATDFMWEAFTLIVLGLLTCLVMLVAREPLQRVKRKAAAEPWKSGLVGLLVLILFAPLLVLVTLILVISIIGIPLVLLVPFFILALLLVAFLGYSGVALGTGEFLRDRFGWQISSPYVTLLLGVLTIQIWSIIGDLLDVGWGPLWFFAVMFGIFGALVKFFAWTVGLGAAVLSRFGSADGWGGGEATIQVPAAPVAPATPAEPMQPAAPSPEEPSVLRDVGFANDDVGGVDPARPTEDEEPRTPDS